MDPSTDPIDNTSDATERCPECGEPWSDEGPLHLPDCRYFVLEEPPEDDEAYRLVA